MKKQALNVVLVDDEPSAITNLTRLLTTYCDEVIVCGSAENAVEGVKVIQEKNPDLVFLDIEMPGGNGFDLLECFPNRSFAIVFVTSYNQHAIKAFRYSAVDYLLKPVDIDALVLAVERVRREVSGHREQENYQGLLANIRSAVPVKLGIATTDGKLYLDMGTIIRIEADGSYSRIFLAGGGKHLVSRNIGEYEELLHDQSFLRVHNSHLINILFVSKYTRQDGGWITMTDGTELPLARRRKEVFESMMKQITRE